METEIFLSLIASLAEFGRLLHSDMISVGATVCGRQVSGPSSNSMHDNMSYSARVRGMDTETDRGSHISKGFPPYFERKKSSLTALTAA